MVKTIEAYLNTNKSDVNTRFTNLEAACATTVNHITSQFNDKCKEYFDALCTFKREQAAHAKRLKEVETTAQSGPTALSLAQALQKRVKSLGNHVANLEARNKHLTEALAATALAPP